MTTLRMLLRRWSRPEADFADEIRAHIDLEADRLVAEGWAPADALLEARRRFGNVGAVTERHHDARRLGWLDDLARDLRYAARTLRRERVYAGLAIIALALGLAANTALFTLFDSIALRPLPVPDAERMVNLWQQPAASPYPVPFSFAEYTFYRDHATAFTGLAASMPAHMRLTSSEAVPITGESVFGFSGPRPLQGIAEPVLGLYVSGNYFDVWRARPVIGRAFSPADDRQAGAPWPAMLSESYWRRRFGGDPAVLGRLLTVNGMSVRVVGVSAGDFMGQRPQIPDVWLPFASQGAESDRVADPRALCCSIDARLVPGRTLAAARAELATLRAGAQRQYPTLDRRVTLYAQTAAPGGAYLHARLAIVFLVFQPAIALVVLIACANVAGLMLGRAAARRREIAVRLALGAGRRRIVRQLLTEAVLLAAAAAALGLALSTWVLGVLAHALASSLPGSGLSDGGTFRITATPDWRIFAYALAAAVATGVVFGLAPALQATAPDLTRALKDDVRALGTRTRSRLRNVLVGVQLAVCLTLLLVAGMLVRAGQRMLAADPGFETRSIIRLTIEDPTTLGYAPSRTEALRRTLAERLPALPSVRSVARASRVPLDNHTSSTVAAVPAGTILDSAQALAAPQYGYALVDPGYFATLGIPLLRGRTFTAAEQTTRADVAVVSAALAERLWPGEDPIGRRLTVGVSARSRLAWQDEVYLPSVEVIGVAREVSGTSTIAPDAGALYLPHPDAAWPASLLVRASGDPAVTLAALARELRAIDPRLTVTAETMQEMMETQTPYVVTRIVGVVFAALGFLGLLMATVGVYGMVGYAASQQTREAGIRLALGARPGEVVRLVLARTLAPVWVGVAAGVALGLGAGYALSSMLAGLRMIDPPLVASIAATMAGIALLAAWVPARRVVSVDPATVLRFE